jgi:hypothetical protein
MFRLNQGRPTETVDREHILLFRVFPVFSGFFRFFGLFRNSLFRLFLFFTETVCFGCFSSIPKQRVSMFQLNQNKQKTYPNSLKESIYGYFSENVGLFRFVTNSPVCFGCFGIGSKHRNKPKFLFLVSRNKLEQTRNRSCFGLFRFEPNFIFVCFEDTFCLPSLHPSACRFCPGTASENLPWFPPTTLPSDPEDCQSS